MKKRSLIVATIMLLVAVITATGTTYAWFTSQSTAKTTVSMKVAEGKTLEISTAANGTWKFALSNEDFNITGSNMWKDYTYTSTGFATKSYSVNEAGEETWGSDTSSRPVNVTVYFRSTASGNVKVTNALSFSDADNNSTYGEVYENARVTVQDGTTYTHLATTSGEFNEVDTGRTGLTQAYSTVNTYATVSMTKDGDYYTGSATFYFWIDGVITENTDIVDLADNLVASLSFTQE